ncbi:MAG: hypothetical protein ACD_60C00029G0011 [uncultured bacterium]|nr:MAG: hypothetical protein ACD_60C00029G0011 [uncultured bacterium]
MLKCFTTNTQKAIPIKVITPIDFPAWLKKQNAMTKNWLTSSGFQLTAGKFSLLPDAAGNITQVLFGTDDIKNFWSIGNLPVILPEGKYIFDIPEEYYAHYGIAFGLGAYQFTRYKKPLKGSAELVLLKNDDFSFIENTVESIYWVRDLINTPTDDMGPTEFASAAVSFAKQYGASIKQIVGDDLLKKNFPCIHTVGRASDDEPRLLDLRWGNPKHPKVTLVGKGVCFDTGGLDIKPSSSMLLMKKDMAGAAHVLGLARMVIEATLPISLRVLIPVVENAISGNAFRPGDIITSRKGITIEIGNTDAEGRLVLADALTEAVSEKPDLVIDISTLTGAARVAVGTDISLMFSNQDDLALNVIRHGDQQQDPICRLPLFAGYREALNSSIADINNAAMDSYAGAITAALFLKEFVPNDIPWLHFDIMAWNLKSKPGHPQGGEAMGLRALFSYLRERYSRQNGC